MYLGKKPGDAILWSTIFTTSNELKKLDTKFQLGGKIKYKDDSSDSDSDSDFYFPKLKRSRILSEPISYWWYDPYVFRIKKYFVPTYVAPLAPYTVIPLYLP